MKRPITHDLKPQTLPEVSSPTLIEHFIRALRHITGKVTMPEDFHTVLSAGPRRRMTEPSRARRDR